MDPQNPDSFSLYKANLSTGHTYQFVDEAPANCDKAHTPTLLCIHGFPDLWYGWRYQIGPWVRKGYRVVVPNMLGYGETDSPDSATEYTTKKLCADLEALLDFLGVSKAVVIGHDWGSYTAARFALWHPARLTALVILSVPYSPPAPVHLSVQEIAKRVPSLRYQAAFSEPTFTSRVEGMLLPFIKMVWAVPSTNKGVNVTDMDSWDHINLEQLNKVPLLLTPKELEFYHTSFKKGMNGPLNYYRTDKFRFDEEKEAGLPSTLRADLPVLFMWGTSDPTTVPAVVGRAHKFIPRLQDVALEGYGHWVQIEAKEEITTQVLDWLYNLALRPRSARL